MKREELKQKIAEKLDTSRMAELEADLARLSDEDLDQAAGGYIFGIPYPTLGAGAGDQRGGADASAQTRIAFFSKYKEFI